MSKDGVGKVPPFCVVHFRKRTPKTKKKTPWGERGAMERKVGPWALRLYSGNKGDGL